MSLLPGYFGHRFRPGAHVPVCSDQCLNEIRRYMKNRCLPGTETHGPGDESGLLWCTHCAWCAGLIDAPVVGCASHGYECQTHDDGCLRDRTDCRVYNHACEYRDWSRTFAAAAIATARTRAKQADLPSGKTYFIPDDEWESILNALEYDWQAHEGRLNTRRVLHHLGWTLPT